MKEKQNTNKKNNIKWPYWTVDGSLVEVDG
jgi:hypothetical protein